jgi:hypothetical protein
MKRDFTMTATTYTTLHYSAINAKGLYVYFDGSRIKTNKIPKLSGMFATEQDVVKKITNGKAIAIDDAAHSVKFWSDRAQAPAAQYYTDAAVAQADKFQKQLDALQQNQPQYTIVTVETITTLGKVI